MIALTITDFVMFEHAGMVSKFKLRDESGRDHSDDLELIFVELPKFTKAEGDLSNMLDKWCYFLRFVKRLHSIPGILAQERRELALEIAKNLHGAGLDKVKIAAMTGLEIADLYGVIGVTRLE